MSTSPNLAWSLDSSTRSNLYESLGCSAVYNAESTMQNNDQIQMIIPDQTHQRPVTEYNKARNDHFCLSTSDNQDRINIFTSQQGGNSGEILRNSLNTANFKNPTNSLWLGTLDPYVHKKDDLKTFFHGWQGFLDVHVPDSGGNFGFARFETAEDAIEAKNFISRRLHLVVNGKPIKVNFGRQMPNTRPNADAAQEGTQVQENFVNRSGVSHGREESHSISSTNIISVSDFRQSKGDDAFINEMADELNDQEHMVHQDVTYYEKNDDGQELGRNDIDEIVGKVDRVRRNSGREELRDCMKRKRSKAREAIQVITKRIYHLYSRDLHKKLMILYGVGEFFYTLPPHRRYDVGAMIGKEITEFLSTVLCYQCDKGKKYVSDVAAALYFYFIPSVRKMMESFIDIELLIELQQEESPNIKEQ